MNNKKVTPAKQSIPDMSINEIISGKKTFPCLSKNKVDTWVMDEEEVSILPEQVTPKQLHSSNKLAHSCTSDSDETMQSHDQDATMERWIPVSSTKKRSKQAQRLTMHQIIKRQILGNLFQSNLIFLNLYPNEFLLA